MATRRRARRNESVRITSGDVKGKAEDLADKRAVRGREPGDGRGPDVGIAPGAAFANGLKRALDSLSEDERQRMLEHVRDNTEAAMRPVVRAISRAGGSDYDVRLFRDVGPNMLRTVMEYLEENR